MAVRRMRKVVLSSCVRVAMWSRHNHTVIEHVMHASRHELLFSLGARKENGEGEQVKSWPKADKNLAEADHACIDAGNVTGKNEASERAHGCVAACTECVWVGGLARTNRSISLLVVSIAAAMAARAPSSTSWSSLESSSMPSLAWLDGSPAALPTASSATRTTARRCITTDCMFSDTHLD
jgi:hypothetical protein